MGDRISDLPPPTERDKENDIALLQKYFTVSKKHSSNFETSILKYTLIGIFVFLIFGNCNIDFLLSYISFCRKDFVRLFLRALAFGIVFYTFATLM